MSSKQTMQKWVQGITTDQAHTETCLEQALHKHL